jgi:HEAT repeat protein
MKKKNLFSSMLAVFILAVLMFNSSPVVAQEKSDIETIINTLIEATLPENQDSATVRMEAVEVLWHFYDANSPMASRIESAILAATKDKDSKVRGMVAESLDVITSRESLEVLVLLSADKDKEVSEIAYMRLMPKVSESLPELADMISSNDNNALRLAALRVIHAWTHSSKAPPSVRRSSGKAFK